jgi:2-polyprenyl-6-methoxyphenol hydroxylase-like FAD-dependent oxidoreductase
VIYSAPGRGISFSSAGTTDPARALFVFRSAPLSIDRRDVSAQKAHVASVFAGLGWEVPRLVAAMSEADDLYFDSISGVVVPRYSSGRIVLLGDAGYGGTLGGQGTGLAMVGAYVLAGELARAPDHETAFRRYEDRMRPYATKCLSGLRHVGPFYAPPSKTHRFLRDRMYGLLAARPLQPVLLALTTRAAGAMALESYPM